LRLHLVPLNFSLTTGFCVLVRMSCFWPPPISTCGRPDAFHHSTK
jgi:hypothetical protein